MTRFDGLVGDEAEGRVEAIGVEGVPEVTHHHSRVFLEQVAARFKRDAATLNDSIVIDCRSKISGSSGFILFRFIIWVRDILHFSFSRFPIHKFPKFLM